MTLPADDKLKVLVVDDDEMNRRMMRLILTREDHVVEIASDGYEACKAAEVEKFDIILMDLQMPGMDGVETSKRIRALENGSKDTYIVALTASYLPERGSELFKAGIDNYIAKPFDVEHLRLMLKHGLDHRVNSPNYDEIDEPVIISIENHQGFDPNMGLKQVGGDEEVFRELLADFVSELPQKIAVMESNLTERNMESLSRGAHNLKGVSANLGLMQLSQHAGRLENRAGEGYTSLVIEDMNKIREVVDQFLQEASNFLETGNV